MHERTGDSQYVTDGDRLYRLLTTTRGPLGGTLFGLENCRSLEVVLMPISEYARLRDVFRRGGLPTFSRSDIGRPRPGTMTAH